MLLYAITDRSLQAGALEADKRRDLLDLVKGWSLGGVDFIQLREKDLSLEQLASLAEAVKATLDKSGTKLLINLSAPQDAWLALAAGADGVHLAGKPEPGAASTVRAAFRAGRRNAILSMACHSLEEVALAHEGGADLILFSPVFEKQSGDFSAKPQGLAALGRVCQLAKKTPVFALGGVSAVNAHDCVAAGAAGVAGIRLFADGSWRPLASPSPPGQTYIVE